MSDPRPVQLTTPTAPLFKILKFEGIASSGAEAKQMIAAGEVTVNGEVELRKRCQIGEGDVIAAGDEKLIAHSRAL